MADIFLNSANFAPHALLTLAPPSGYALNLKALIKVSKVSWTSHISYEILRYSFERKFDESNFISPKFPCLLGLNNRHWWIFSTFQIWISVWWTDGFGIFEEFAKNSERISMPSGSSGWNYCTIQIRFTIRNFEAYFLGFWLFICYIL